MLELGMVLVRVIFKGSLYSSFCEGSLELVFAAMASVGYWGRWWCSEVEVRKERRVGASRVLYRRTARGMDVSSD